MNGVFYYLKCLGVGIALLVADSAFGQWIDVRWHNEQSDTTRITEILKSAANRRFKAPGDAVAWSGSMFMGTPYKGGTLEGDTERLTVNLDSVDCTTFVDIALALAYTIGENRQNWQDFIYNLMRMRYRSGNVDGYSSRLHYISDWAMDNIHRGNIVEVTGLIPMARETVRSIDFMTAHRDRYAALNNPEEYSRMKEVENSYRNHRFMYVRTIDLGNKKLMQYLRDGDIVAFVPGVKNLDVSHLGILTKDDKGQLHVMHASQKEGSVVVSKLPLVDFAKRNPRWIGARFFRLKE